MSRVAARPAAVVPPRAPVAQKPNPAVAAAAPVQPAAAAPAAVAADPVAAPPVADNTTAAAAPVAAAAPAKKRGRKPGAQAGRVAKPEFPGLYSFNEDGTPVMVDDGAGGQIHQRVKLSAVPTDYDSGKFAKLRPADFTGEDLYCEFMAANLLSLAAKWEKKAKKLRTLGQAADKKATLKFLKLRDQLAALRAQLLADGTPEDLLDSDDEIADGAE